MSLLITLLLVILIFAVVFWIIGMIPFGPDPQAAKIRRILQVGVAIVFLIWLLLVLLGHAPSLRIDT